jgi:hypothetical protein
MKGSLSMSSLQRRIELPLVGFLFLIGSAFLLKMCYLSLAFNTVFGIAFLAAVYFYLRTRFALHIPIALLLLVFIALQVDALGNYLACMVSDLDQCNTTSFHTSSFRCW